MKIIEPHAELIDDINAADIYAKIERCGRVCYQSQSKGKPEDFIRMLIKRGHESVLEHVSLTAHIICDRAIQNELVRHRHASFSVESTRFVKHDELEVVKPPSEEFPTLDTQIEWELAIGVSEANYRRQVQRGVKPEQARSILPLCSKSELYMTCNLREWRYILKLRTSKHAHPQMRTIMTQILAEFKEKLPVIVEDFTEEQT